MVVTVWESLDTDEYPFAAQGDREQFLAGITLILAGIALPER